MSDPEKPSKLTLPPLECSCCECHEHHHEHSEHPIETKKQLPPTDLHEWQQSLLQARSGADLLDAMLRPHDAERLIAQMPVQDLQLCIHRIGLGDCTEIVECLSGDKLQSLMDLEVWDHDTPSLERLDPWLNALMQSGPHVLGTRLLALDWELLQWTIRRSVQVEVIEDPNEFEPPDAEHVLTPDGHMCIIFPESSERDLPVKIFLDWLMREDSALCTDLLLFSSAALDSNLEEEALHWRNGRLADEGYIDFYEALSIYAPPPQNPVTTDFKTRLYDDPSPAERWLVPQDELKALFSTLPHEEAERLEADLGHVVNLALSADRVELWDEKAVQEVLLRLRSGILLGLELSEPQPKADVLRQKPLAILFREAYAAVKAQTAPLLKCVKAGDFKGFSSNLDGLEQSHLLDLLESLTARHPSYNGRFPQSKAALQELSCAVELLCDLGQIAAHLKRPDNVGILMWLCSALACNLVGKEEISLKVEDLHKVQQAIQDPLAEQAAASWWQRQGGHSALAVPVLLKRLHEALDHIDPQTVDLRILPLHFDLETP